MPSDSGRQAGREPYMSRIPRPPASYSVRPRVMTAPRAGSRVIVPPAPRTW
ncbi:hypothetical protein [Acrocarpospora pleiomorpha]|uniref:hypothetical protein n=1 Tax=Acrocarpospora pleiomorpha TaxID=90975 RepID=UPI001FE405AF|nr:hypothetical protein [Acrocarpospora pleiomorpha]